MKSILNFLSENYKYIIGILLACFIFALLFTIKSCCNYKSSYLSSEEQSLKKEALYLNKQGELASEVKVQRLRYSTLEKAKNISDSMKTEYSRQLAKAYDNIEIYKRQNKDLKNYISFNIHSEDTIYLIEPIECDSIPMINNDHIRMNFIYRNDSLVGAGYNYSAEIYTLISLFPKKKSNGKNHFPNWGFIWGFDNMSITTCNDTCAKISNQISIEFKK